MSDTIRTDVLLIAHDMAPTHISLISHARELERELNSANQIIRQQQLLEEENQRLTAKVAQLYQGAEEQKQRIMLLEEAGDKMADLLDGGVFMKLAVQWHEAKEAKP